MHIVLLNQFFWPDTIATSQFLTDLAAPLAEEHQVTAICGESRSDLSHTETWPGPNLSIIRTRTFAFERDGYTRMASYVSYLAGTLWHGLWLRRPTIYITLTTPPVLSVVGSVLSTLRGTEHVIWEMDVYPDIATDVGYFPKNGITDRIFGPVLDWSRRRATTIIVLGEDMKTRLLARGIPESKIEVADNWADGREITPQPFPEGPLVIHYSGNLGIAHETDTIADLIRRLGNHPDFHFIFSGSGSKRPGLEDLCRNESLLNVEFRPYCSRSELGHSLAEGHIGLVTQLPQTVGSVVPSKIYGIMAAGRPLLYIGPSESTPARHIRSFHCGWRFEPGDTDALEQLLLQLKDNRRLLVEAGSRARNAFEEHFDRPIGIARIRKILRMEANVRELIPGFSESARGD
jgi:glycosyltransferase involved in cell wall biosynthesis